MRQEYRNNGASVYQDTIGDAPAFEIRTQWFCSTQCEPGKPHTESETANAASIVARLNSHADLLAALIAAENEIYGSGAPLGSETYFKIRTILSDAINAAGGRKAVV